MKLELFSHFTNPFAQGWIELKRKEKIISTAVGILCSPLFGLGGFVAFYTTSGVFKCLKIKEIKNPYPLPILNTNFVVKSILTLPAAENDPFLTIETLERLVQGMLEKMRTPHPSITQLPSEDAGKAEWINYLTTLHQNEPGYFRSLLSEAVDSKDADLFDLFYQSIEEEELKENLRILGIPKMCYGDATLNAPPLYIRKQQAKSSLPSPNALRRLIAKCHLQQQLPPFNCRSNDEALDYCQLIFKKEKSKFFLLFQTALSEGKSRLLGYFLPFIQPKQLENCITKTTGKCQLWFGRKNSITTHITLLRRLAFFNSLAKFDSSQPIELPENEYAFFRELHSALFLNVQPRITKSNCLYTLTIASKYGFIHIETFCEEWLLEHIQEVDQDRLFYTAEACNNDKLMKVVIERILSLPNRLHRLPQNDQSRLRAWMPSLKELAIPKQISASEARFLIPILLNCHLLQKITLNTNNLELLKCLKNLPSLKSISLKLTRASKTIFSNLKGMPIRKLDLSHAEMSDKLLGHIRQLPIKHLNLSHNPLIRRLGKLPDQLHAINLSSTMITNDSLARLTGLKLRKISFSSTDINIDGLLYLAGQPLETVNLNISSIRTFSNDLVDIIQTWQKIQVIHILGITIPRSVAVRLKAMGAEGHYQRVQNLYHVTKLTFPLTDDPEN
ncbi:MAG: hypothetical protein ACSNEK_06850 [Parachlamydiaceae bacterium]